MNKFLLTLLLWCASIGGVWAQGFDSVAWLIKRGDPFVLARSDQKGLSLLERRVVEAHLANAFNRVAQSTQLIESLLENPQMTDSIRYWLYKLQIDNHVKGTDMGKPPARSTIC